MKSLRLSISKYPSEHQSQVAVIEEEGRMREFSKWFKAQFGHHPNESKRIALRLEIVDLRSKLRAAENYLLSEEALQSAWNNSLYGWNAAKDSSKSKRKAIKARRQLRQVIAP